MFISTKNDELGVYNVQVEILLTEIMITCSGSSRSYAATNNSTMD